MGKEGTYRMVTRLTHTALIVLMLTACVGCDQITKAMARQYLAAEPPLSGFYDTIRLQYAENAGAFLSLGTEWSQAVRVLMFQILTGLWIGGLFVFLVRSPNLPTSVLLSWSLVLGGGVGNLLDRLLHNGRVIDFMNVGIGPLRTGIFNVADVCITVGVIMLIVQSVHGRQASASGST